MTPPNAPPRTSLLAPSAMLGLGGLRAMVIVSGVLALLFGFLFVGTGISFLRENLVKRDGPVFAIVIGALCLGKAALELSAAVRLGPMERAPLAQLPFGAGFVKVATVWLMVCWGLLVFGLLHAVLAAVLCVVFVVGFVVALLASMVTLGFGAKEAFSKWWSTVEAVASPFSLEGRLWAAVAADGVGAVVLLVVAGLMFVGPSACAAYLHARMKVLRRR
ncbi:MAG: hypothetical protein IPJ34_37410 [Myxococcales bacterium]|nr:hypothetical protein [Myxococcales bacterium]